MFRNRTLASFLLAIFLAAALTSCGVFGSDDEGGGQQNQGGDNNTVKINLSADIPDLNSTTTTDVVSFDMLNNLNEGLFRLDENEEPQPAMAESVETSDDGLNYTFTLRDGIEWSNGDPVTSQDFKYAWLRAMNPDTAGQYSFIIADFLKGGGKFASGDSPADIVGIETPDDKTLEVTLANPAPFFLGLTAFPTYFPQNEDFVKEQGDNYAQGPDSLLYNGPYTMTQFNSSDGATLKKNDGYWDADNVAIETADLRVIKDVSSAVNLWESGDLDITSIDSDFFNEYEDSDELLVLPEFTAWWLQMNLEDEVMSNKKIRQAIQKGIDTQAMADEVLRDGSEPATGLVPKGMSGPDDETFREAYGDVAPEFDPGEAKQLWEEGVQELGNTPTLELLSGDTSTGKDLGTFVQAQLQENLGAEVQVNTQPFDRRLELQKEGKFQMGLSGWGADYNDPMSFMDLWVTGGGFNDISFSNEEYDQLIEEAKTSADNQLRMNNMSEAEKILIEQEAAIAPQYFAATPRLVKSGIENVIYHPYGAQLELKYMSIEQ
ncbi:MAG: peptide ABC transporter substrate-binding protein [Rubrobacteraceae bacterium]